MEGFTRIKYEDGFKYTMTYPPGWGRGDRREPVVQKEPWAPTPSSASVTEGDVGEQWPYIKPSDLPRRQPRRPPTQPRQPETTRTRAILQSCLSSTAQKQSRAWSHPLWEYLEHAWMPSYLLSAQVDPSIRYEWPDLYMLVRPPPTHTLYLVQRIYESEICRAVDVCALYHLCNVEITSTLAEQGKLANLCLPDPACVSLGEKDACFIDSYRISNPSGVMEFLQAYPLCTVLNAITLFCNLPDDAAKYVKFSEVNHFCSVQNADLFDLIALPNCDPNEFRTDQISLLVVCVAPWDILYDDLEGFICTGIPDRNLNLNMGGHLHPANVLWTVILDVCHKHGCRYFILTTYDDWVFGTLSADMHRAHVTTHLRAPVFSHDTSVSTDDLEHPRFPVPNVFETLMVWILAAISRDQTWWPLPPDMPNPIGPGETHGLTRELNPFVSL